MLKPGIYRWEDDDSAQYGGTVRITVRETQSSFIFTLVENTCKYDTPELVDMFRDSEHVVIRKSGSKHGMVFHNTPREDQDDWFCLYPYRCGVPYAFSHEDRLKELERILHRVR